MTYGHCQEAPYRHHLPEAFDGAQPVVLAKVLPHGAHRNQVEQAPRARRRKQGKAVVQPFDPHRRMELLTRFAKLFDGLDGQHAVPLISKPYSVATGSGSDVSHSRWGFGEKVDDRSVNLARRKGVKPGN